MTPYDVNWLDDVLGEVVQSWLDAPDSQHKSHLRRATDEADRVLASDPERNADHVSEGLWRLEIAPLRLFFVIDEELRVVEVTGVRFMDM